MRYQKFWVLRLLLLHKNKNKAYKNEFLFLQKHVFVLVCFDFILVQQQQSYF